MRYIILGIYIFLATFLLIRMKTSKRKSNKENETIISLSKILLYVGAIGFGLFIIASIVLFLTNSTILSFVFLLFSIMGYSLLLAYFNCTITYNETEFTHRNFWGISKTFSYNDITGIYSKKKDVKIFIGKKCIRVDETAVNKDIFIGFVRKQYRKSNNGNAIPIVSPKSDIFKGNIANPGEFIFVYSSIIVFIVVCLVIVTVAETSNSSKEIQSSTVSFAKCNEYKDVLYLYTSDNKEYRIAHYKKVVSDLDGVYELCNGREALDVTYTFHDDEVRPFHWLESITAKDGTIWLSAEVVEEVGNANARLGIILISSIVALMLIFIVASIYIGRNVEKFKPWIVKLFFKSNYVNWQ